MYFSSLLFLFVFLPIVLAVYYIVPRKFRNAFLLLANLVFYGWGEPVFIFNNDCFCRVELYIRTADRKIP